MAVVNDQAYLSRCGDPAPKPALSQETTDQGRGPQIQISILPVENYPPPQAIPFNPATYVALPAIGATATILDVLVPAGMSAIVKRLGNNFVGGGFVDGSGNLVWQVLVNGVPARNFENIIASLGNPAVPSDIGFIRGKQQQHIKLTVKNVGVPVNGQLVGGRFSGWFYPNQYDLPDAWY
jgi:hypothetical protein